LKFDRIENASKIGGEPIASYLRDLEEMGGFFLSCSKFSFRYWVNKENSARERELRLKEGTLFVVKGC